MFLAILRLFAQRKTSKIAPKSRKKPFHKRPAGETQAFPAAMTQLSDFADHFFDFLKVQNRGFTEGALLLFEGQLRMRLAFGLCNRSLLTPMPQLAARAAYHFRFALYYSMDHQDEIRRDTEAIIRSEHQALLDELEVALPRPQFMSMRAFAERRLARMLWDVRALYN
jgi:hypothetical protein